MSPAEVRSTEIHVNLSVEDIDASRDFDAGFLGLCTEDMNLGWVARFLDPDTGVDVQLATSDATSPVDSVATIKVDDVEAAYDAARERGYEIVHPLTTEG